jgi:hypothetical protein
MTTEGQTYDQHHRERFERYCLDLGVLVGSDPSGLDLERCVSRGGTCHRCKGRVPAGLPLRACGTAAELCPSCVVEDKADARAAAACAKRWGMTPAEGVAFFRQQAGLEMTNALFGGRHA